MGFRKLRHQIRNVHRTPVLRLEFAIAPNLTFAGWMSGQIPCIVPGFAIGSRADGGGSGTAGIFAVA